MIFVLNESSPMDRDTVTSVSPCCESATPAVQIFATQATQSPVNVNQDEADLSPSTPAIRLSAVAIEYLSK